MLWFDVCVALVFAFVCDYCSAVPSKLTFSRCNYNGFTCVTNARNLQDITYQCPSAATDVRIDVNEFSAPRTIETLWLTKCKKLTISTRCSNVRTDMKIIRILNIDHLIIQSEHETHFPPVLHLENISYIETIPSNTFSQTDKSIPSKCSYPQKVFSELYIKNVFVDTVMTRAFFMPYEFQKVSITNVSINRMQTSAFDVGFMKNGTFLLKDSKVNVIEHLGLKIHGHDINFIHNEFVEMGTSSINGTITNFTFVENSVNTLQPDAISILSKNVNISFNSIEFMQSGALEKIGPGLLEDSKLNFGKLRFKYEFSNNTIMHLHSGCLQPDMTAYENVASEMTIKGNEIMCTCPDVGWMFSKLGYGYSTLSHSGYYEIFLERQNQNHCVNTDCNLPISNANRSILHGACIENYDFNEACRPPTTTTARPINQTRKIPSTSKAATSRPRYAGVGSFLRSSSQAVQILNIIVSLPMFILMICLV